MDAAAAAAMSDPDRNRQFRRRWIEVGCLTPDHAHPPGIGALGLALLDALNNPRRAKGPEKDARNDGDPPR